MVTPELVRYLKKGLERGAGLDEMRQALRVNGWKPGDIEAAVRHATRQQPGIVAAGPPALAKSEALLMLLFRAGFAGVFLVNSLVALADPGGFVKLMQGSFVGAFVRDFGPLVWAIAANDLALGLLILSGRWQSYVLAWSGLWLLAVTLVKLSSLFHLG